jgi:4-hydroxy-2-oxoheptanedioate aldolase
MSKTLKERFLAGEEIIQSRISMASTREQVHETIADTGCEMIYIDCQHGPYTEWDISRICKAAEEKGMPVLLRIKHTRHAYRLGNYCDLGVFAIKVPEVETEEIVDEAINSFYFPPIGRRSWGGWVGYGIQERKDRVEYAKWWNENGILGFKVESLKSVLNIRSLVKPGITYIDFGPSDLMFDIETRNHPYLKSVSDCREFILKELEGVNVRFS